MVEAEGGRVLVEPSDVAHLGRFAVCMDSQGAEFALWLPFDRSVGAGVADEPSARCWVELACEDIEEARHFYGKVFGWDVVERQYLAAAPPTPTGGSATGPWAAWSSSTTASRRTSPPTGSPTSG
ncbi:hypothetical protein LUX57_41520 [Actinomadura madurae]|uniref:VOC family protein n=1 Tax=Actinomadura madurae TaxID=1993 RepID=UPI0020D1F962|nr:VOC family protein [Actinomadura madurae]MCP9970841.1 hypothetical protein [Actinomadura madurae]